MHRSPGVPTAGAQGLTLVAPGPRAVYEQGVPHFIPSAALSEPAPLAPLWLVFRNGKVLVDRGMVLLESGDVPAEPPVRTIRLGTWDGRPVMAIEVAQEDTRFVSLRAALMSVDAETMRVVGLGAQLHYFHQAHAFCGRCSAATVEKANERARHCNACGLDVYPRVSPAMIVLVHDGEKLLLAHRPNMPFFALVAGFVEAGETLEECVAREVMEEVGLRVSAVRYFGSQPWPFPHQVMIGFVARFDSGVIQVDGVELDEAHWFARNELPPLPPSVSIARRMIDAFVAREDL